MKRNFRKVLREENAWVSCSCGKEHLLKPGIDSPIYWCGDELKKLCIGDEIETSGNIDSKVTDRIKELSLKFSHEILEETTIPLYPCQMQILFSKKWEEYALTN